MKIRGFDASGTLLASVLVSVTTFALFHAPTAVARDVRPDAPIAHRKEPPPRKFSRQPPRKAVMDAPGVISTLPVQLTAPGNYSLSSNLFYSQSSPAAIVISASGVTLDCGWHSIRTSNDTGAMGISIGNHLADVSVSNCILDGFYTGIRGNTGGQSLLLSGNEIRNSQQFGIYVGGDSSQILMNRIVDLKSTSADPSIMSFGIFVASYDSLGSRPARGVVVQGNQVAGIGSDSGDVAGIILRGTEGAQVLDNKILDLRPAPGHAGYGIWLTTSPRSPGTPVPTTGTVIDGNAILARVRPTGLAAYKVDSGSSDATSCTDNITVGLVMPEFRGCVSSLRNVGSGSLYPIRINGSQPRVRGSAPASARPNAARTSSSHPATSGAMGKAPVRDKPQGGSRRQVQPPRAR